MVKLPDVIERAAAVNPDAPREQVERTVREVIAAIGHEVSRDGEVYNPAEGAYRPRPTMQVPRDQMFSTRRRGHR